METIDNKIKNLHLMRSWTNFVIIKIIIIIIIIIGIIIKIIIIIIIVIIIGMIRTCLVYNQPRTCASSLFFLDGSIYLPVGPLLSGLIIPSLPASVVLGGRGRVAPSFARLWLRCFLCSGSIICKTIAIP